MKWRYPTKGTKKLNKANIWNHFNKLLNFPTSKSGVNT